MCGIKCGHFPRMPCWRRVGGRRAQDKRWDMAMCVCVYVEHISVGSWNRPPPGPSCIVLSKLEYRGWMRRPRARRETDHLYARRKKILLARLGSSGMDLPRGGSKLDNDNRCDEGSPGVRYVMAGGLFSLQSWRDECPGEGEKKSLLPSLPHSLSLLEGRGVSSHLGGRTNGREGTE